MLPSGDQRSRAEMQAYGLRQNHVLILWGKLGAQTSSLRSQHNLSAPCSHPQARESAISTHHLWDFHCASSWIGQFSKFQLLKPSSKLIFQVNQRTGVTHRRSYPLNWGATAWPLRWEVTRPPAVHLPCAPKGRQEPVYCDWPFSLRQGCVMSHQDAWAF